MLKKWWKAIPYNLKAVFFSTFAIGMLVHMFMFTNLLLNADGLSNFGINLNGLTSGRWFQQYATSHNGIYPISFVLGTTSIIFLAVSACLVVDCLKIKHTVTSVMAGIALVLFPSTAAIFAYMYTVDGIFMSALLSILCVYLSQHSCYGFLFGGVALAFSMAIYQSYISFSAGLFIIILILDILRGNGDNKIILIKGLKYFFSLCIGVSVYYIVLKISLVYNDAALSTYMGIDEMGIIPISQIIYRIKSSYVQFWLFFTNHPFFFSDKLKYMYFIIGAIAASMAILIARKRVKITNLPLLAVFFILLPLAVNSIYFFVSPEHGAHDLMTYPLVLMLVFCACLLDEIEISLPKMTSIIKRNACVLLCWVQVALIFITFYNYNIVINQGYLQEQITIYQVYRYSSNLLDRIKETPGYEEGLRVIRVGRAKHATVMETNSITGILDMNQIIHSLRYRKFFKIYFGEDVNIVSADNEWLLAHLDEVNEMPVYPAEGSIKRIDKIMVLKLSG